jgi:hypothetical protein
VTVNEFGQLTAAANGAGGGITCSNPPTVANTVPIWTDTTGTLLSQQGQTNADVAQFNGPVSASGVSTILTNVCFGARGSGLDVAGGALTTGSTNTLIGAAAGRDITDLKDNVCVGYGAGRTITSSRNTVMGSEAGRLLAGSDNIIIGYHAVLNGNAGSENVVIGNSASQNLAGSSNTLVGSQAGIVNAGERNIVLGQRCALNLTTGNNNIFIAQEQTPGNGNFNVGIGGAAITGTGTGNIVIGNNSNSGNTTSTSGFNNCLFINSADATDFAATASNQLGVMLNAARFIRSNFATQTTVGAAGGASALPATPTGYLRLFINGTTEFVIPFYAQA